MQEKGVKIGYSAVKDYICQIKEKRKYFYPYASPLGEESPSERPYRWIKNRLVRTCYRENIRDIKNPINLE